MATGAIVGGILGGALGSVIPGAGTALGYSLGSGIGGLAEGAVMWNKANNKQISETDPRTRLLYDEIVRKRKGLESGQLYQPQQDAIRQAGAQTMQTAAGVTGGDIGATVSALRGINRSTGRNLNELYGQMMGQSTNLLGQQTAVDQMLYNWNYQKQAYEKQQAMAHAAQTLKDSMANTNAVIASRGKELGTDFKSLFGGNNGAAPTTGVAPTGVVDATRSAFGQNTQTPEIAAPVQSTNATEGSIVGNFFRGLINNNKSPIASGTTSGAYQSPISNIYQSPLVQDILGTKPIPFSYENNGNYVVNPTPEMTRLEKFKNFNNWYKQRPADINTKEYADWKGVWDILLAL